MRGYVHENVRAFFVEVGKSIATESFIAATGKEPRMNDLRHFTDSDYLHIGTTWAITNDTGFDALRRTAQHARSLVIPETSEQARAVIQNSLDEGVFEALLAERGGAYIARLLYDCATMTEGQFLLTLDTLAAIDAC